MHNGRRSNSSDTKIPYCASTRRQENGENQLQMVGNENYEEEKKSFMDNIHRWLNKRTGGIHIVTFETAFQRGPHAEREVEQVRKFCRVMAKFDDDEWEYDIEGCRCDPGPADILLHILRDDYTIGLQFKKGTKRRDRFRFAMKGYSQHDVYRVPWLAVWCDDNTVFLIPSNIIQDNFKGRRKTLSQRTRMGNGMNFC